MRLRDRMILLGALLILGVVALAWPKSRVPVPERIGTSRDWTAEENAAMFRPVIVGPEGATAEDRDRLYDELGRETYAEE